MSHLTHVIALTFLYCGGFIIVLFCIEFAFLGWSTIFTMDSCSTISMTLQTLVNNALTPIEKLMMRTAGNFLTCQCKDSDIAAERRVATLAQL